MMPRLSKGTTWAAPLGPPSSFFAYHRRRVRQTHQQSARRVMIMRYPPVCIHTPNLSLLRPCDDPRPSHHHPHHRKACVVGLGRVRAVVMAVFDHSVLNSPLLLAPSHTGNHDDGGRPFRGLLGCLCQDGQQQHAQDTTSTR